MKQNETIKSLFKNLELNKNNYDISIELISKINEKLEHKTFNFTKNNLNILGTYLYVCNKYQKVDYLNKELNKEEFIKLLDLTNISGSMLLSLTSNCDKPRKLLISNSKKIKDSILIGDELLSLEEIINDLTNEEITILRKDININNLLISKGLSFDTLKPITRKQILKDLSILGAYDIKTINAFLSTLDNLEDLVKDKYFLDLYLSKLTDDYSYTCPFLNNLSYKNIEYILKNYQEEHIILHLLINTTGLIQKEILKYPNLSKIILKHKNESLLSKLPCNLLKNFLEETNKLFDYPVINFLSNLDEDKLSHLALVNPNYYSELLTKLSKSTINLTPYIRSLTSSNINDLKKNHLKELDIISLTNLLLADSNYKKDILKNRELCTNLVNSINLNNYYKLTNFFSSGHFTDEEKVLFISNVSEFKNNDVLNRLLESLPLSHRKFFYDNELLRTKILNNESYQLDDYAISYYLNNSEEISSLNPSIIKELLIKTDLTFNEKVLKEDIIVKKLLTASLEDYTYITDIILSKKSLIKYFNTKITYEYYNKELISNILNKLSNTEKRTFIEPDLIKKVLGDKYYNIYKKLLNNNSYLLNTLDFRIFEDYILNIKLSILDYITKYPSIENSLITINKYYPLTSNLINNLYYQTSSLSPKTLSDILELFANSCLALNRKKVGNLPKLLSNLNPKHLSSLTSYLLYQIPRFYKKNNELVPRPIILDTPNTYEDIINYENNTVTKLTSLINISLPSYIKEYFIQKHFKLTKEEANIILDTYNLTDIDINLYNEEYLYLTNLRKIMNTDYETLKELDQNYKTMTMLESFTIIEKLKTMYGKIYNYELRSKNINYPVYELPHKKLNTYKSKDEFLYLVSNINLDTSSNYLETWYDNISNNEGKLTCSLISNENLVFDKDYYLGFNGLEDNSIISISPLYLINNNDNTKELYTTPYNLLDNTRDYNNTIILNSYIVRSNYKNANIPYIEPDYLLVNANRLKDTIYLEQITKISLSFKSKRNPLGLPIIILDPLAISRKEITKINRLMKEYTTSYDPNILAKLLTRLENNYTAYKYTNELEALKYDIYIILNTIINRICYTNSIYELNRIEEIFELEAKKYQYLSNELKFNYYLNSLKKTIATRKNILNNY